MQLWQFEHFFLDRKVPVVLYRFLFVKKKNIQLVRALQSISVIFFLFTSLAFCLKSP
jgi:hypothetical protein